MNNMPDNSNEKVKMVRLRSGLSRKAFADKIGVTDKTIGNWEGETKISFFDIMTVCREFHIQWGYFEENVSPNSIEDFCYDGKLHPEAETQLYTLIGKYHIYFPDEKACFIEGQAVITSNEITISIDGKKCAGNLLSTAANTVFFLTNIQNNPPQDEESQINLAPIIWTFVTPHDMKSYIGGICSLTTLAKGDHKYPAHCYGICSRIELPESLVKEHLTGLPAPIIPEQAKNTYLAILKHSAIFMDNLNFEPTLIQKYGLNDARVHKLRKVAINIKNPPSPTPVDDLVGKIKDGNFPQGDLEQLLLVITTKLTSLNREG